MSDTEKSLGLEKAAKEEDFINDNEALEEIYPNSERNEVKRSLQARHISMIALGGTIGTGLFISTKGPISTGPGLALIAYLFITTLAYSVTQSLGEMATHIPCSGSFTQFAARFCSPALGAANGWNYWFSWAITFALEVSVVGQVIEYWSSTVPLAVWISIFWVVITILNMFPVRFYGEIEFWIAGIKILAVMGWLIYALCMVCGAGDQGPIGFRYWRNPGAWGNGTVNGSAPWEGVVTNLNTERFLAWLSSLISALFTFAGVELVGISCGESANPRKTVPSAIKKVIWRIIIFYVLSIFFMGLLVPYNDPALNPDTDPTASLAASSPFIIAIQNCGTKYLASIFNAVILMAVVSAANSNVYSGSRILYGLAEAGVAPKIFLRATKSGIPYVAVLSTAIFGSLGYMALSQGGATVFNWLLNITAVSGLIAWVNISFSHIRFMHALKYNNMTRDDLPFKAFAMPFQAYYAFILGFCLVFVQGFSCFYGLTASGFFTAYISVILFLFTWLVAHFYYNGFKKSFTLRSFLIPLDEIDVITGSRDLDNVVWEEPDQKKSFFSKFYSILS